MPRVDRLQIGDNVYELRGSQIKNSQTTISNLQNTVNNLIDRTNFLESRLRGSIRLTLFEIRNNNCYIMVQTTNISNKDNIRYYTIYGNMYDNIKLDITSFVKYVSGDNNNFRIQVSTNVLSSDDYGDFDWDSDEWNIQAEVTDDFGNNISYNIFIIDPFNKHTYVDLGLPSGTLWATMNIGANSIYSYGNYYMYGMGSKIYNSADTPYTGTENPLSLNRDTANVVWGGDWHVPTQTQIQELINNTTYVWITNYGNSGINGGLFVASNGRSVFFPAGGFKYGSSQSGVGMTCYYWESTPYVGSDKAYYFYFRNGKIEPSYFNRNRGFCVRGVVG